MATATPTLPIGTRVRITSDHSTVSGIKALATIVEIDDRTYGLRVDGPGNWTQHVPHREVEAVSALPIDVPALVKEYRANQTQLRRLHAAPQGRNVQATILAITRRANRREEIEQTLIHAGHAQLVGELVEEHNLTRRVNADKALGRIRPELKDRLTTTRSRIKLLLPA